jgi:hypothetical protein
MNADDPTLKASRFDWSYSPETDRGSDDGSHERGDPAAVLDQVPDLSERLRDADGATKRALFEAFDLRVVYDKADDRLSINATLTEAVAAMLRNGLEPLCNRFLREPDSPPSRCLASADDSSRVVGEQLEQSGV